MAWAVTALGTRRPRLDRGTVSRMRRARLGPALQARLSPPPTRPDVIVRAALVTRLSELSRRKVTLLTAPTGWGKTTLLAQWAATDPRPVAWITLEPADGEPARFWALVAESLTKVCPGLAPASPGVGSSLSEEAIPRLLNSAAGLRGQILLVLDDFQTVDGAACCDTLGPTLERLPESLRLIVAARTRPSLALGRLLAAGELGELGPSDLRLDRRETGEVVRRISGVEPTAGELEHLASRTEGWPAGVRLAAGGLPGVGGASPGAAPVGASRHVAEYLGREVLDAQPEHLLPFLFRTSILDRLTAPLCDALLGRDDSGARLAELEHAGLFVVRLDGESGAYRYHRMFGEVLRAELVRREPTLVPALHRGAAACCDRLGDPVEAVRHLVAGGETARAREYVRRRLVDHVRVGRRGLVREMLAHFPADAVERSPALAVAAAWAEPAPGAALARLEHRLAVAEQTWSGTALGGDDRLVAELVRAESPSPSAVTRLAAAERLSMLAPTLTGEDASLRQLVQRTATATLGFAFLMCDRPAEALDATAEVDLAGIAAAPAATAAALAARSLASARLDRRVGQTAAARASMGVVSRFDLRDAPGAGLAHLALGLVLRENEEAAEAERLLAVGASLAAGDPLVSGLLALERARSLVRTDVATTHALLAAADDARQDAPLLERIASEVERELRAPRPRRSRCSPGAELSDAEVRVLRLLPTRLTQREIARELYLSPNTVKTHVHTIYRKLGASSRVDAVRAARALNLV